MSTPESVKVSLRSRLLTARAGLALPFREEASAVICRLLLTLPEVTAARAVLAYAAFGSEVDLDPALRPLIARGVGVFLPWVDGPDLRIARVRDLDADLAPGWRGVREPRASDRRPARPDRIHIALVPGVGFDRRGRRLGYGGGHFDRLLGRLRPGTPRIGVAFRAQVVEHIPALPHDVPVDAVVTEEGVERFGA
jgi:5-formyltetrahydrofolate cyclo-ligase